jgi:predicted  nucleic acid-binding Zn-ribbon protein
VEIARGVLEKYGSEFAPAVADDLRQLIPQADERIRRHEEVSREVDERSFPFEQQHQVLNKAMTRVLSLLLRYEDRFEQVLQTQEKQGKAIGAVYEELV